MTEAGVRIRDFLMPMLLALMMEEESGAGTQGLLEAGRGFRRKAAMQTPWFHSRETHLGPLTSRTVRKHMCAVFNDHGVYGHLQ